MIERFLAKELVGFEKVELELGPGLVVISGPSGAGKSVLMQGLLATLGMEEMQASVAEAVLLPPEDAEAGEFEWEEPFWTARAVRKGKTRYTLNDLTLSKKRLAAILKPWVRHISQRHNKELSSAFLLELLDAAAAAENSRFAQTLARYRTLYRQYEEAAARLARLEEDEKRVRELMEFARFEIERIDQVAPKVGEDEALMAIKRKLSKKERIAEAIEAASAVFELEGKVAEALGLLEADTTLFDEAMNQLRADFERGMAELSELDDIDVEGVLDRIEALADLKRRYGSIEAALEYREKKAEELAYYEGLDSSLERTRQEAEGLKKELEALALNLEEGRQATLGSLEEALGGYTGALRLSRVRLELTRTPLGSAGRNGVRLWLGDSGIDTLSGGEFNRIRLALLLMRAKLTGGSGVLLIDEIDANVSGDESIAIARLLKELSKTYQVVAISHQPHLSAAADWHLKVEKKEEMSEVRRLKGAERIDEIARMIAGEKGRESATLLAQNLLKEFAS